MANDLLKTLREEDRVLSQGEHCAVRDHLFVIIHFSNGHRSGFSANMLLSDYYSAIPDKNSKDGSYLIGVRNHKTFSYYGQAMVILKQIEYKWLKIYVEKIRSRL